MTILVTGATGFLGKRVCRLLEESGRDFERISLSLGTDLRDQGQATDAFQRIEPTAVLNCAAYVGGIQFGLQRPAEIFRNNMLMITNIFDAAHRTGARRVVNPISNCVYPRDKIYFREAEIWDGPLDETVMVYGLLRKMSWAGSWSYARQYGLETVNLVFSNMYGPGDHFDEQRSHALGALIMKTATAKRDDAPDVIVWGSGNAVREWLYVDDAAEAMVRGLDCPPTDQFVNVGVGRGTSIRDLAMQIRRQIGYEGELVFDTLKPDGAPYKTVDGTHGKELLEWAPRVSLDEGLTRTVSWYLSQEAMHVHS